MRMAASRRAAMRASRALAGPSGRRRHRLRRRLAALDPLARMAAR